MAKKYWKNGEVCEGVLVKTEEADGKVFNVKIYGATDKEWRDAGWVPVEEHYAKAIAAVKKRLAATDYIALKSVEGSDVDTLYPDWKASRAALRDQINALEVELESILNDGE